MDNKELIEEVCEWLQNVLFTDHAKNGSGLNALFPDIIMCDKYFTVNELTDALKEHFNNKI